MAPNNPGVPSYVEWLMSRERKYTFHRRKRRGRALRHNLLEHRLQTIITKLYQDVRKDIAVIKNIMQQEAAAAATTTTSCGILTVAVAPQGIAAPRVFSLLCVFIEHIYFYFFRHREL